MKRIKNNNSTTSFILLFLFFLVAIIFMLIFLHIMSIKRNVEDTNDIEETTSVTTKTTETTTTTVIAPVDINFEASLARVLSDTELVKKYNTEVGYNDAIFTFKCATYDEADKTCEAGSALMTIDDITFNLYTFASSSYDYSIRPNDYYIIVQDNYVILAMNKAGIEPGVMKIYTKKGKSIKDIKNYISGYLNGDHITNMQYPKIENDELSLFYCNKNKVYKTSLDLKNNFAVISDEKIEGVSCY